jgi:hypothetical protein
MASGRASTPRADVDAGSCRRVESGAPHGADGSSRPLAGCDRCNQSRYQGMWVRAAQAAERGLIEPAPRRAALLSDAQKAVPRPRCAGGKAKPLKQAKKGPKEYDDDGGCREMPAGRSLGTSCQPLGAGRPARPPDDRPSLAAQPLRRRSLAGAAAVAPAAAMTREPEPRPRLLPCARPQSSPSCRRRRTRRRP